MFLCGSVLSVLHQSQILTFHFKSQSNLESNFRYGLWGTALVNIITDFKAGDRGAPLIILARARRSHPGCTSAVNPN